MLTRPRPTLADIILNTYVKDPQVNPDKLAWDVHFWIGNESTQDEYGTAGERWPCALAQTGRHVQAATLAAHTAGLLSRHVAPPAVTLRHQPSDTPARSVQDRRA